MPSRPSNLALAALASLALAGCAVDAPTTVTPADSGITLQARILTGRANGAAHAAAAALEHSAVLAAAQGRPAPAEGESGDGTTQPPTQGIAVGEPYPEAPDAQDPILIDPMPAEWDPTKIYPSEPLPAEMYPDDGTVTILPYPYPIEPIEAEPYPYPEKPLPTEPVPDLGGDMVEGAEAPTCWDTFKIADTNGDGLLDLGEWETGIGGDLEKFIAYDASGDKYVSADEFGCTP